MAKARAAGSQKDGRQQPEPPRGPKRRRDDDPQGGSFVVPNAIAVGTAHAEKILAGGEAGKGGEPPVGADRDPGIAEARHAVQIPVLPRSAVVQRRELEGDDVVPVRELDLFGVGDRSLEWDPPVYRLADGDRAVEELEVGDDDVRDLRVDSDLIGVEGVEAVDAAEEHLPARTEVGGAAVEFVALQTVANIIVAEGLGQRVEARQALGGAGPQPALTILEHRVYGISGESVLHPVAPKSPGLPVEPVDAAAKRAEPQRAVAALKDGEHVVGADAGGVSRIVPVTSERTGFWIEAVEPAALRSYPEHPLAVLEGQADEIVADAGGILGIMPVVGEHTGRRVHAIQPAPERPEPKRARAVLIDRPQLVVAQGVRVAGVMPVVGHPSGLSVEPVDAPSVCADPEHAVAVPENDAHRVVAEA